MNPIPPNVFAVVLAALSVFVIGGVWYSPLAFGSAWQRLVGLDDAALKHGVVRAFAGSAVMAVIVAVNLGFFIGGASTLAFGAFAGFATGFGFIGAGLAMSYLFARKPWALIGIDAGYHVVTCTLAGVIIGAFGTGAAA